MLHSWYQGAAPFWYRFFNLFTGNVFKFLTYSFSGK